MTRRSFSLTAVFLSLTAVQIQLTEIRAVGEVMENRTPQNIEDLFHFLQQCTFDWQRNLNIDADWEEMISCLLFLIYLNCKDNLKTGRGRHYQRKPLTKDCFPICPCRLSAELMNMDAEADWWCGRALLRSRLAEWEDFDIFYRLMQLEPPAEDTGVQSRTRTSETQINAG